MFYTRSVETLLISCSWSSICTSKMIILKRWNISQLKCFTRADFKLRTRRVSRDRQTSAAIENPCCFVLNVPEDVGTLSCRITAQRWTPRSIRTSWQGVYVAADQKNLAKNDFSCRVQAKFNLRKPESVASTLALCSNWLHWDNAETSPKRIYLIFRIQSVLFKRPWLCHPRLSHKIRREKFKFWRAWFEYSMQAVDVRSRRSWTAEAKNDKS